jgi:hypothetical protein
MFIHIKFDMLFINSQFFKRYNLLIGYTQFYGQVYYSSSGGSLQSLQFAHYGIHQPAQRTMGTDRSAGMYS